MKLVRALVPLFHGAFRSPGDQFEVPDDYSSAATEDVQPAVASSDAPPAPSGRPKPIKK